MSALLLAIALGLLFVYGAEEIVKEGGKKWGKLKRRVRKSGPAHHRAAVAAVSGAAWLGKTYGRGLRNSAKDDLANLRALPGRYQAHAEGRPERTRAKHAKRDASKAARERRKAAAAETRGLKRERREAKLAAAGGPPDVSVPVKAVPPAAPANGSATPTNGATAPPNGAASTTPPVMAPGGIPPAGSVPAANGAGHAGGGTMPASGEVVGYGSALTSYEQMQADADEAVKLLQGLGSALELANAGLAEGDVDQASRQALNAAAAAAAQAEELAGQIRPALEVAASTLRTQQGPLAEAHAAQPQAATREFLQDAG